MEYEIIIENIKPFSLGGAICLDVNSNAQLFEVFDVKRDGVYDKDGYVRMLKNCQPIRIMLRERSMHKAIDPADFIAHGKYNATQYEAKLALYNKHIASLDTYPVSRDLAAILLPKWNAGVRIITKDIDFQFGRWVGGEVFARIFQPDEKKYSQRQLDKILSDYQVKCQMVYNEGTVPHALHWFYGEYSEPQREPNSLGGVVYDK